MSFSARFRPKRDDEGIGLIEVIVSIGVSAMVLLAVLATSLFAVRASADARKNQQAADYLNAAVEAVRAMSYASTSMRTSDLSGDASIVTVAGVQKYDPGTGLEPISATTSGLVYPHVQDADQGKNATNGDYKVYRYVTVPTTATYNPQGIPSVRRLTVVVTWQTRGISHSRKTSTLLTNTRRGLPLPNYTWTYNGPATLVSGQASWTKAAGATVDYGLVLTNLGARDSWTVTASTSGWTYYLDTNHDGLWSGDVSGEPMVSPANTGLIEPGSAAVYLVAHRSIATTETGTSTTVFTATSDAQPSYASKSVTTTLTISGTATASPSASASASPSATPSASSSASACTPGSNYSVTTAGVPTADPSGGNGNSGSGYTPTSILLYNGTGTLAYDTSTISQNSSGTDSTGLHPNICNYSTDAQTNQAGRYLASSGYAEWLFQPLDTQNEYRGYAYMTILYQCVGTVAPQFTVKLGLTNSAGTYQSTTHQSQGAVANCPSTGFATTYVQVDVGNNFDVPTNGKLSMRISSTAPVRLLFGATAAQGKLSIGMK